MLRYAHSQRWRYNPCNPFPFFLVQHSGLYELPDSMQTSMKASMTIKKNPPLLVRVRMLFRAPCLEYALGSS